MSVARESGQPEPIAIIGMSGRFPGAANIREFWRNLCQGKESIFFFSDQELLAAGVDSETLTDPNYVRAGGVLDDIELFDAFFFGFSPREAELIDPQQRLFLECAWEALEDAGYDPEAYPGSVGIYAGAATSTYQFNLQSSPALEESVDSMHVAIGNDKDHLTTHVSYKLNLKGPSVAVQTACSTSLVAVCLACDSLLRQQCDMALAGGVSIKVSQKLGYVYQEGGIMSPDGHCRTFDASAKGIVGGNGLGIVVLKRLRDAVRDGDHICAMIRGCGLNNDGSLKVAYTAPSLDGQAKAISAAQLAAGVDPETITYIEAHGTGTPVGDPIEVAALTHAFGAGTGKKGFCALGSVKTNIGHLDPAAGIAGLIKTVLALQHRLLPPSLHFREPNPEINFADTPFYVNTSLSEWKSDGSPRRAAVSSFGIGGTNAHVVLEEAPDRSPSESYGPWHLLLVSARTDSALERRTAEMADYVRQYPEASLADVAFTCQAGRKAFEWRRMLVCRDRDDVLSALDSRDPKKILTARLEPGQTPIVFMFPGQGAQYANMGEELYRTEPTFRRQVDLCSEILIPQIGLDLRQVMYCGSERRSEAARQTHETNITQPALFATEYALARLWIEWGVQPQAMIGHSVGEYVAACLAGILSLEDALFLIAARGRLMQEVLPGAMLAIPFSEQEVQPLLNGGLALAAVNGPSLCVISGPISAIAELESRLSASGVNCRRLSSNRGFHSEMMEPILQSFLECVRKVNLHAAKIPYLSNVTGTWITTGSMIDEDYFVQHLRQTVRFNEGLKNLFERPGWILLEVGPGRTLSSLAKQHPDKKVEQVVLSSLPSQREQESDRASMLGALGRLWMSGAAIDWAGVYAHRSMHRVALPTYPFERQRFWIDAPKPGDVVGTRKGLRGKKPDIADWFYVPSWKRTVPPGMLARETGKPPSTWLIFADTQQVGSRMATALQERGHHAISVAMGRQFARITEDAYLINPSRRSDYDLLFSELRAQNGLLDHIVHSWTMTSAGGVPDGALPSMLDRAFYSLLFLTQALGERNSTAPVQITILSNRLVRVTGEEIIDPEKAVLLGPCRVVPREYANVTCRCIDLDASSTAALSGQTLVDPLIAELTSDSNEVVVSYRGGQRWSEVYEPLRLQGTPDQTPRLRQRGTYLITGGLGGIGVVFSSFLAQRVQANLILTGRVRLPERENWDEWLRTHAPSDPISARIQDVISIEKLGGRVFAATADVTDLEEMQQLLQRSRAQFGHIHGVFHAAGIAGGGLIQLKTREAAEKVLAPKIEGARVLQRLFRDAGLDFLVLCSSMSSVIGPLGQVDYSSANAFLDALAHASGSSFGVTSSINWDTWQEVGMLAKMNMPASGGVRAKRSQSGIRSREGIDALARILRTGLPQVIVCTMDLQAALEAHRAVPPPGGAQTTDRLKHTVPLHPRPALFNSYVAPRNEVEESIVRIWQELLGIDGIGVHDNFIDLGGHSLVAIQVVSRLRDSLHVELTVKNVFEAPTVAELAELIACTDLVTTDRVTSALDLVEGLSEDETKRALEHQSSVQSLDNQ